MIDLTDKEWEELCDGCGKCCGFSRARPYACPGLNCDTNRCTVYEERHDKYMCSPVTPENTLALYMRGVLPSTCAYVRHVCDQEPLERPVEAAVLTPFSLAPLSFRRKYNKANKAYLKMRRRSN